MTNAQTTGLFTPEKKTADRAKYMRERRAAAKIAKRTGEKKTGSFNRAAAAYPAWCVPTRQLSDFIHANHEVLAADYGHIPRDIRNGLNSAVNLSEGAEWRQVLVPRLSFILRMSETGVLRRLYTVLSGESIMVNINFAEGCCIAVGKHIDKTGLTTLPGNLTAAKELIACRADHIGVGLADESIYGFARKTVRISKLIAAYPHNKERLLDIAPLDCLRPYR